MTKIFLSCHSLFIQRDLVFGPPVLFAVTFAWRQGAVFAVQPDWQWIQVGPEAPQVTLSILPFQDLSVIECLRWCGWKPHRHLFKKECLNKRKPNHLSVNTSRFLVNLRVYSVFPWSPTCRHGPRWAECSVAVWELCNAGHPGPAGLAHPHPPMLCLLCKAPKTKQSKTLPSPKKASLPTSAGVVPPLWQILYLVWLGCGDWWCHLSTKECENVDQWQSGDDSGDRVGTWAYLQGSRAREKRPQMWGSSRQGLLCMPASVSFP